MSGKDSKSTNQGLPATTGWLGSWKGKKLHILHADPKPWDSLLHGARGKAISIDD